MESEYPCAPALVPMPQGSMDADGYLSFSAKAVRLVPSPTIHDKAPSRTNNDDRPKLITATDGSTWAVCDPSETDGGGDSNVAWRGQVFAVLLGFFVQYFPGGSPAHDANNVRAMLVEAHAAGKFHVRSYFMLSIQTRGWAKTWAEHSFSLGGPRVGDQHGEKGGDEDDEMLQEVASPDLKAYFNIPTSRRPMRTLEEQLQRKSRWAIPQHVLEKQIQPNSSS
ncbi:hypothetical protein AN958_00179 [Leucoagaricus sp. SymC.cos]|nr:hypothetical protein AN958_00179 [Leucoagaricus sp. SymC.cos]